jgi:hypothetical protein
MVIGTDHGYSNCGIFKGRNNTQEITCWSEYYGKHVEDDLGLHGILPGWHILRFEVEPGTMTISYIVDGRQVGAFVPQDSIPGQFTNFKQSTFSLLIALNNFGPSKAPVGYIDYVRMGAIADDLAKQDPFIWAVGTWEATDKVDKSHLTLAVERVLKNQYNFLYRDEQANVCKGGSGMAKFAARIFSNFVLAPIEFFCDPPYDIRVVANYKFTYNLVDDQLVDSYDIVWNRIK